MTRSSSHEKPALKATDDVVALIGLGVGLLDFFGIVLIGAAGLLAGAAGGSIFVGVLGDRATNAAPSATTRSLGERQY